MYVPYAHLVHKMYVHVHVCAALFNCVDHKELTSLYTIPPKYSVFYICTCILYVNLTYVCTCTCILYVELKVILHIHVYNNCILWRLHGFSSPHSGWCPAHWVSESTPLQPCVLSWLHSWLEPEPRPEKEVWVDSNVTFDHQTPPSSNMMDKTSFHCFCEPSHTE